MASPFELAGTANPIGIAVDQDLEHRLGLGGGTARLVRVTGKRQGLEIQGVDEGIAGPRGVIGGDILVETERKQHPLPTFGSTKSHGRTPSNQTAKRKSLPIRIMTQAVHLGVAPGDQMLHFRSVAGSRHAASTSLKYRAVPTFSSSVASSSQTIMPFGCICRALTVHM
jgi:hypothetical protein